MTSPWVSMTASINTFPCSPTCLAKTGYFGAGCKIRRGAFTRPPTRTGALNSEVLGAGAETYVREAPEMMLPITPPSCPPGTLPGTPPATPAVTSGASGSCLRMATL